MQVEQSGTEVANEAPDLSNDEDGESSDAVDESETTDDDGEEGEAEEYQPNYAYRYYGKNAEMDEWARQFIQDKATEDRFRALYAKSGAFETLREQLKTREGEFSGVQNKFGEVQSTLKEKEEILEELQYRRDNDLGSFFEYADVSIDKVIDFVDQHLKDLKRPEAERNQLSEARQHAHRARDLEKENQNFRTEAQQREFESHTSNFEELFDNPEVVDFSDTYDDVAGKPGAFRLAVIDHGEAVFLRTGKTISPLEAIREVYRQYKPFVAGRAGAEAEGAAPPVQQQRRPTIPNVGGSGARAPAKRTFTSVEELKAHHKQMVADGE